MIVYLTGTGNTLLIANMVAESIGERRVVDIADLSGNLRLEDGEPLGVFFPVHGWRPPQLLRSILSNITIGGYAENRNYVYAVCTVGDTVGEAMRYLAQDFMKMGVTLNASFDVQMPNTYIGLPFMDVDSKELEDRKLHNARLRVRDVAGKILARTAGENFQYKGRWPRTNSRLLGCLFKDALVTDVHFRVDASECVGCGICLKSCPTHDIKMSKSGIPEWKHNKKCMTCFACYHNCPKHAIRYGWMTHGKGQYRLPIQPFGD